MSDLPVEVLSRILTFASDINEMARLLRVCWDWNHTLTYEQLEQHIWLPLVRKYYPDVENLVDALSSAGCYTNRTQAKENLINSDDAFSTSLSWKTHFKRRHIYLNDPSNSIFMQPTPPPPSLSSYLFQIDWICETDGNKSEPKILTKVFDGGDVVWDPTVWDYEFDLRSLSDELFKICFTSIALSLQVIQKKTGRQAVLYNGAPDESCDGNLLSFSDFETPQCLGGDDYAPCPLLHGYRCDCECRCKSSLSTFFIPHDIVSPSKICSCEGCAQASFNHFCSCCQCEDNWKCFHDYKLTFSMFHRMVDEEESGLQLDENEHLEFLDRLLRYL